MKTNLLHVRINVSNLAEALKWYEDTLGFKVTGKWPHEKPNYAHFDVEKGAIFSIMEVHDAGSSKARLNFTVTDVDSLWNELKDKVEIIEELFNTPYGTRKFTISDPDGNELGFVQVGS